MILNPLPVAWNAKRQATVRGETRQDGKGEAR